MQVGMQKELEIATAEMDRAQHRLVMLEREKHALEQQVQTPPELRLLLSESLSSNVHAGMSGESGRSVTT